MWHSEMEAPFPLLQSQSGAGARQPPRTQRTNNSGAPRDRGKLAAEIPRSALPLHHSRSHFQTRSKSRVFQFYIQSRQPRPGRSRARGNKSVSGFWRRLRSAELSAAGASSDVLRAADGNENRAAHVERVVRSGLGFGSARAASALHRSGRERRRERVIGCEEECRGEALARAPSPPGGTSVEGPPPPIPIPNPPPQRIHRRNVHLTATPLFWCDAPHERGHAHERLLC